jgi:cyanophycinase
MGAINLPEPDCGPLLIVGGAEDKTGGCIILRELVRLAGSASARIAVLTVASEYPREVGDRYVDVLTHLGAGHVEQVHVQHRGEANPPEVLRAVDLASAVYFAGGIQSRITRMVADTALADSIHRRWRAGLPVGGTSASAAAMSEVMIVGSSEDPHAGADSVLLGRGLGFVPHLIVDQHFGERRRLRRLQAAVARHPDKLGIGIDEDTAMVLHGDVCEVIGAGSVTVVDGRRSSVSDTRPSPHGEAALTMDGTGRAVLASGDRVRLPLAASLLAREHERGRRGHALPCRHRRTAGAAAMPAAGVA